jgi:hypothetical protein
VGKNDPNNVCTCEQMNKKIKMKQTNKKRTPTTTGCRKKEPLHSAGGNVS